MLMKDSFQLAQFIFVASFTVFLAECVDYPILFKDKLVNASDPAHKVTLGDAVISPGTCIANFGAYIWIFVFVGLIFWIVNLIFVGYNTVSNWEIRAFYRTALGIQDCELDNLTWYDVQKKLREVQRDQQMCIHKQDLTELDIYHRILRFKNYMIAMINKSLLPLRFNVPIVGEVVFLTHGMKYNLEFLLFWGPWAPFESSWHLREDYKKINKRKELADILSRRILWVGLANLALSPAIFLWQILYSFFNYAEVLKREPGTLGMRRWSLYGRQYLRHFNELEHEFNARLSRAYRPAAKYMSIFNSPALTVLAQNIAFVAGAVLAVLSLLTIYDEDVLNVEHVLLLLSAAGAIIAVSRAFIPDEQLVWCPERLLTAVLAHVHYFPDQWKGQAHTSHTRDQFALLFQYKAVYLLEELLSPFITPIILIFHLRSKSLEIADFYRNFTVEVIGVGDVCSFAQMDIRKHGNPSWQNSIYDLEASDQSTNNNNAHSQAENGKTELSLVHFTHTNPEWQPPSGSGAFIANLKERAARDASNLPTVLEENPFYASLNSISSMGNEYSNVVTSLIRENNLLNANVPMMMESQLGLGQMQSTYNYTLPQLQQVSLRGFLSKHEGPIQKSTNRGIVAGAQPQNGAFVGTSYNNSMSFAQSFAHAFPRTAPSEYNTVESNSVEMSLDALYIHEIHHLEMRRRQNNSYIHGQPYQNPNSASAMSRGPAILNHLQQPQVHYLPATPLSNARNPSNTDTEKTPLLSTKFLPMS
jgi:autophagy-related protein 9